MKITRNGVAGTMESSDLMVLVAPNEDGRIKIELESSVKNQFGTKIYELIQTVLNEYDVKEALVKVDDHGALDCTIRARLETAIMRAAEEGEMK